MVEWGRPFSAIRKDPHWKRKVVLAALVNLIPYVGTVWYIGWAMEYMRDVAWGEDARLPEWSGFSRQALLGLKGFVAVLPYSLALSAVITPIMFVAILAGGATGSGIGFMITLTAMMLLMMGFAVLLYPLTASAQLRVSLYGTIESGFQFGELWRLMREKRSELNRAWGYSALNTGISLAAMLVLFAILGGLFALGVSSSPEVALLLFAIGVVIYFAYMTFGMALSVCLGLANMHYFGSFGRAAYRLDEARAYYAAASAAPAAPPAP